MEKNGEQYSSLNYVDKSIAETKLYVQEEIKSVKKQLNTTFVWIALLITILAGLGVLSISLNFLGSIVKDKISDYSIDEYVKEIESNRTNSINWLEEIKGYLKEAKINSKELDKISFKAPQLISLYEDGRNIKIANIENWIQVPFSKDKKSSVEIGVVDSSNVFMVIYSYRVKDKTPLKKWSGIRVSNLNNDNIRLYHTDGGYSNSNEYGSSGAVLITNLSIGSYTISLEDYSEKSSERTFYFARQFAIYRLF